MKEEKKRKLEEIFLVETHGDPDLLMQARIDVAVQRTEWLNEAICGAELSGQASRKAQIRNADNLYSKQKARSQVHQVSENDGNSQFRALAQLLGLDESQHMILRQMIVAYIHNNAERFEAFINEKDTCEAYCNRMQRFGEPGDHLTLHAAADVLGSNIVLQQPRTQDAVTTFPSYTFQRETMYLACHPEGHCDATSTIAQIDPLLTSWINGHISEEISPESKCVGPWYLLLYENRIIDNDFTGRILRTLKQKIPVWLGSQLDRFFAYSEGHRLYAFICIDSYIGTVQPRNRAFFFNSQFDLDNEHYVNSRCPRLFTFKGHPHPSSVEWDLTAEWPRETWDHIDGRLRN